jgi:hypothetical protein
MTFDTRLAVSEYQRRGWALAPIAPGAKVPTIKEWQHRHYSRADFDLSGNLAGIFGARSGSLFDADLDCPEALTLADLYLPTTSAEFGRLSRPRSHRLYIAPGAVQETSADPAASGDMMVELGADGATGGAHMTLLPPSTTDGEQPQWHGDVIAPAAVGARALQRRMAWLAVGCLVMRYVSESAARRPAPDLPRLLWEFEHELGRPAYRWVGRPDPDAPQRYPRRRSELSERDLNLAEIVAAIPNDFGWEGWKLDKDGHQRNHCFACGAHGDVIEFLRRYDNPDCRSAVVKLASALAAAIREQRSVIAAFATAGAPS